MRITRRQIRKIILEYEKGVLSKQHVDGHPWSGTLEDLATAQGRTWGHGEVVDPKGWHEDVKMAGRWTNGTARTGNKKRLDEKAIANVSDLTRQKEFIEEWADLLLEELQERLPNGQAIADWKDKTRQATVEGIRSSIVHYLIGALGSGLDAYGARRQRWEKEAKAAKHHKDQKLRGLR
jgi:hypothetical protein